MGPSSWAHVGPKPVVRVGDAKIRRASSAPPSSCGPSSWAPVGLKPDVRLGDSKTRRAPSRVPSSCFPSLRHYRERCTHAGRRRTKPDTEAASATHAARLLPRPAPQDPPAPPNLTQRPRRSHRTDRHKNQESPPGRASGSTGVPTETEKQHHSTLNLL